MIALTYRGVRVSYDATYACFDFQVLGHAFTTLQLSAVYSIIDNYLEAK